MPLLAKRYSNNLSMDQINGFKKVNATITVKTRQLCGLDYIRVFFLSLLLYFITQL